MGKAPLPQTKRNCYPPYLDHYLKTLHIDFDKKKQFVINKIFLYMLVFFFYFFVSSRIWLAKQCNCPAISCSWSATHLASIITVFFIFLFVLTFLLFLSTLSLLFQFPFSSAKLNLNGCQAASYFYFFFWR